MLINFYREQTNICMQTFCKTGIRLWFDGDFPEWCSTVWTLHSRINLEICFRQCTYSFLHNLSNHNVGLKYCDVLMVQKSNIQPKYWQTVVDWRQALSVICANLCLNNIKFYKQKRKRRKSRWRKHQKKTTNSRISNQSWVSKVMINISIIKISIWRNTRVDVSTACNSVYLWTDLTTMCSR